LLLTLLFSIVSLSAAAEDAKPAPATPDGVRQDRPEWQGQRPPTDAARADPNLPSWAPAAMRTAEDQLMPGRVIATIPQISLFLPEAWRSEDVVVTEIKPEDAATLHPLAQSGLTIEVKDGKRVDRLITIFRAPLQQYRELANAGKAGPGRIVLTDSDFAYVAVRESKGRTRRFKELNLSVDDLLATLSVYDERRERLQRQLPVSDRFKGKLSDGRDIDIQLASDGTMTLTLGQTAVRGQWLQRDSQLIAMVIGTEPKANGPLHFHFDGESLTATKWDEIVFGQPNVRLDPVAKPAP
jgi:hypothetical protein